MSAKNRVKGREHPSLTITKHQRKRLSHLLLPPPAAERPLPVRTGHASANPRCVRLMRAGAGGAFVASSSRTSLAHTHSRHAAPLAPLTRATSRLHSPVSHAHRCPSCRCWPLCRRGARLFGAFGGLDLGARHRRACHLCSFGQAHAAAYYVGALLCGVQQPEPFGVQLAPRARLPMERQTEMHC